MWAYVVTPQRLLHEQCQGKQLLRWSRAKGRISVVFSVITEDRPSIASIGESGRFVPLLVQFFKGMTKFWQSPGRRLSFPELFLLALVMSDPPRQHETGVTQPV
jgi:hypothetical protein